MSATEPDPSGKDTEAPAPRLQHQGGTADDHGRDPGAPSRVGTGSTAPPADSERVSRANPGRARPATAGSPQVEEERT
ncbi:hypothetical protein ACFWUW_09455 [Streptomyces sp. NPDC058655]|uniref:hypothetical protein n=1 Tax=unclassified Streptomyces TaxID=2593676 RepID=UPI003665CA3E